MSTVQPDTHHPIAYFCAEFALRDSLPTYAGGLGILAGDYLREVADQGLPYVGISLLYRQGYFRQDITASGEQHEHYADFDLQKADVRVLRDTDNRPIKVILPYKHRQIAIQVWHTTVGHVPIYLLDTDLPENSEDDRRITRRLYEGDQHIRIKQEFVLGIGGATLLRQLHVQPAVYHLNEGHSAFAVFEIARQIMTDQDLTFIQALDEAKRKLVFTNHTIVPAGNDIFPTDDVLRVMSAYADQSGLAMRTLLVEGSDPDNPETFSMTVLAIHSASRSNAVSHLHGQMAATIWPHHRFYSVTNGVHMPTWVAPNIQQVVAGEVGQPLRPDMLGRLNPHILWQMHQENKQTLLDEVRRVTGVSLNSEALTVVWARRFAMYKRPLLVLDQLVELKKLADRGQKLQLIFAGKAHPSDETAHQAIAHIHRMAELHGLSDWVVFMPNYRMGLAKLLVAGADIWLNTPIRGQEASGTSGMKAGANGALMMSINDGWMPEVNWKNVGWILPDHHTDQHIIDLLKDQAVPMFFDRTDSGIPVEWTWRMRQTMAVCWQQFSAARMLKEYQEFLYQPVLDKQT